MCTVSFLPKPQGFFLAVNRDEKRDRVAALAPAVIKSGRRCVIFPREPTGGTWISANDAGICLTLINWHRIECEPKNDVQSRGIVVQKLAGKSTANEIAAALRKLPLRKLRPFRLIAVFGAQMCVTEWRWDLERLTRHDHEWHRQHWFSSGFDERAAERVRAKICACFLAPLRLDTPGGRETPRADRRAGVNAGYGLNWLRLLHRSHAPKRGPFSICMHRTDAGTVSYTEVAVSKQRATMRYKAGPCCSKRTIISRTISLAYSL